MRNKSIVRLIAVGCLSGAVFLLANMVQLSAAPVQMSQLAKEAMSDEPATAARAIAALRAEGPPGLEAFWSLHKTFIDAYNRGALESCGPGARATWARLEDALSKISGQRDDQASHLYWYTDLDQAEAAARTSGKPILSLRLLGRLDEEYSCANSRFFRTTLYPNAEVSACLRDHFILHWKSVRPVPRITVDFGDGRKIERTITGNSIHYILDSDGRPIDALPGLSSARAFVENLTLAEQAARRSAALSGPDRDKFLADYHRQRADVIAKQLAQDLSKVGKGSDSSQTPTDETWARLGALRYNEPLDRRAQMLVEIKNPTAKQAMPLATTKSVVESPLVRQLSNLQRNIATDTAQNEYQFHALIHTWLAGEDARSTVEQLNRRVYAQLFLTPDSDPWLGLAPNDTFCALPGNGIVNNTTAK
jgi:hypothetical protein